MDDRMTIQNDDTPDARTSMDHTRLESHPASAVPSLQDNEELRPPRVRSTPRTESERIAYDLFEQIALERSEVAFSEFYDRFAPKVYTLLLRMVHTEEDALDLLQEVFILLWDKAPSLYKMHGNPAPWLIQLARNRAMDEIKSRRFKSSRQTESFDSARHDSLMEDDRTPEYEFTNKEAHAELRNALGGLSASHRKVIELVFFGGMTYKEAADSLQIPMGTVSSLVRQAIQKLGQVLKPRMGDESPVVRPRGRRKDRSLLWQKLDGLVSDLSEEGSRKWQLRKMLHEMEYPNKDHQ